MFIKNMGNISSHWLVKKNASHLWQDTREAVRARKKIELIMINKSIFLKIGLFLVLGFTAAVFTSCDKNNDSDNNGGSVASTITATNVINSSSQIITVKAMVDGDDVLAQAPYQNNGFILKLPENVAAKYLDIFFTEDIPQGITVSDKNAKSLFLESIDGYNANDNAIGNFLLEEVNGDNEHYTIWVYADRDVTIKGEFKEIEDDYEYVFKIDLTLKKGWNAVCESYVSSYNNSTKKDVYAESYTSQKPSGVNYSWHFYGDDDLRSAGAITKSVENTKSVFSILKENRT